MTLSNIPVAERYSPSVVSEDVAYNTALYTAKMKPAAYGEFVNYSDYCQLENAYFKLLSDCKDTLNTMTSRQFNYMKDIAMGDH